MKNNYASEDIHYFIPVTIGSLFLLFESSDL